MVYIIEYLLKFASNVCVDRIWDLEPFKKLEGEYLMGKGTLRKVRGNKLVVSCLFFFVQVLESGMCYICMLQTILIG